jgi:hypothetical protein
VAVLLYVDGVLSNSKGVAIKDGLALYRVLKEKLAVILLCDDKEKTDRWLKENKLMKTDNIVDNSVPGVVDDLKFRQAQWCRSQGPVDYVVTSDVELAKKLLEHGFRTLLFLDPVYLDHKFRPDSKEGRKSWLEIQEELDKQDDMYLEDPRI